MLTKDPDKERAEFIKRFNERLDEVYKKCYIELDLRETTCISDIKSAIRRSIQYGYECGIKDYSESISKVFYEMDAVTRGRFR